MSEDRLYFRQLLSGRDFALTDGVAQQAEVAELLARYDLLAVAVVDAAQRLVGVVTVDDVMVRMIERTS